MRFSHAIIRSIKEIRSRIKEREKREKELNDELNRKIKKLDEDEKLLSAAEKYRNASVCNNVIMKSIEDINKEKKKIEKEKSEESLARIKWENEEKIYKAKMEELESINNILDKADMYEISDVKMIMEEIEDLKNCIRVLEENIANMKKYKHLKDKIDNYLKEEKILTKIKDLINVSDGDYITKQINVFLKSVENKINDYLKNTNIKIKHNDENILTFSGGNNMNSASGFEHFIVSICMREIIMEMKSEHSPLNNILFIDEGFGVCDKNNIQIFANEILPRLSEKTQLVLISHNSNINSIINSSNIVIKKPLSIGTMIADI